MDEKDLSSSVQANSDCCPDSSVHTWGREIVRLTSLAGSEMLKASSPAAISQWEAMVFNIYIQYTYHALRNIFIYLAGRWLLLNVHMDCNKLDFNSPVLVFIGENWWQCLSSSCLATWSSPSREQSPVYFGTCAPAKTYTHCKIKPLPYTHHMLLFDQFKLKAKVSG